MELEQSEKDKQKKLQNEKDIQLVKKQLLENSHDCPKQ